MIRIILIAIVKNEQHIIERMLHSIKDFVHGICITDTGSTDNTMQKIQQFAKQQNKPCMVYTEPWKNFGHNRTVSFDNAVTFCKNNNFDLDKTYGLLLDADMQLDINRFDSNVLTQDEYYIMQKSSTLRYYNTRLIRLSKRWKCVGVTHEYWEQVVDDTNNNHNPIIRLSDQQICIIDLGDGGSKTDKFTRDIQLLESGIVAEPNNVRYYFYLAQSYKDTKQYQRAIDTYTKCISLQGWEEQTWYCYYMISVCWLALNEQDKFVTSALQAYEYRKTRAEPLYHLVNYYRVQKDYQTSYYYYKLGKLIPFPKNDILFIEPDVYNHLFDYEYTILHYYISNDRLSGLFKTIDFLNTHPDTKQTDIVFGNMKYYMPRLLDYGECIDLDIADYHDFVASSVSLIELHTDRYLANVRFVNYTIDQQGNYVTQKNATIRTRNAHIVYDHHFNRLTDICFMRDRLSDIPEVKNPRIIGLEDVRLFADGSKIGYTASTVQYSYSDAIRIVRGLYDPISKRFTQNRIVQPPNETACEKNWICYHDTVIYKWYPLTLGKIVNVNNSDTNSKLVITHVVRTPEIFRYYRGSSNIYTYNDFLWTITHGVEYGSPRKYFHQVVVMTKDFRIVNYSAPFYFNNYCIEYCLGLMIRNDTLYATVSSNDRNPVVCKIKLRYLQKIFLLQNNKGNDITV